MTFSKTTKNRKPGRPAKSAKDGREAIKEAALVEFARNGFKGASIADIADAAGVAKPLVHYHFESKEELWKASVSDAFDMFQAKVADFATRLQSESPEELIDHFALAIVYFSSAHPSLVRITINETNQGGERADWLKSNFLIPMHNLASSLIGNIYPQASGSKVKQFSAFFVPMLFGATNFPYIDSDVVSEFYDMDVYTDEYGAAQARYVSLMIRAFIEDANAELIAANPV